MAIVDFSYPYLRLARKYGIPYEDALIMGDYNTHARHQKFHQFTPETQALVRETWMNPHADMTEFERDFFNTAEEFHRIQREGWEVKE